MLVIGANCCMSLTRHFAVVGALVALGIHQFGFFVQQLVSTAAGYEYQPDFENFQPAPRIPSNGQQLFNKALNSSVNGVFNMPKQLQIARIANATNYTYQNFGHPPCKHFNNEIVSSSN